MGVKYTIDEKLALSIRSELKVYGPKSKYTIRIENIGHTQAQEPDFGLKSIILNALVHGMHKMS